MVEGFSLFRVFWSVFLDSACCALGAPVEIKMTIETVASSVSMVSEFPGAFIDWCD